MTFALLRLLRERGVKAAALKAGPDYIDSAFHARLARSSCNIDLWAMRRRTAKALLSGVCAGSDIVVAEGAMGLFDAGFPKGASTADLALYTGWPIVFILDAAAMGESAAALLAGFHNWREGGGCGLACVLFNRVASARHAALLRRAAAAAAVPVLGCLPRCPQLALPSRHLGLHLGVLDDDENPFACLAARAARWLDTHADSQALIALARPLRLASQTPPTPSWWEAPPPGKRIAVARDAAFAFAYPWMLRGWRAAGAEITLFSPLAGESPPPQSDFVFLPGGYPQLHGRRICANAAFFASLRALAAGGARIYGECGGFMVLGQSLTDSEGRRHPMAGLLPLHSHMESRSLTLGYRELECLSDSPLGAGARWRGHEFHYADAIVDEEEGEAAPLFLARSPGGRNAPEPVGLRRGGVMGSFVHLIDFH